MSIKSVVGHNRYKDYFIKAINRDEVSHSYIFDGVNGIGKKKIAFEISKFILCKDLNDNQDSCDKCSSCIKFNTGNHPDFMLIEPDGNSIKNEIIEDFQEFIHIKPNESNKKIVIIDYAEKMTISAQNRILKILEEPPEYALIILVTSKQSSIIPTIISRCQHINFNMLSLDEIKDFLILNGANDQNAQIFSRFSNGSIFLANKIYSSEDFINLRNKVIDLSNILIEKKNNELFSILKTFDDLKGIQNEILELLEIWFRDLLFLSYLKDKDLLFNLDKIEILKIQASKVEIDKIVKYLDFISNAKRSLDNYVNYALVLEDLFLKIQEV